jgi:hypothetical protein
MWGVLVKMTRLVKVASIAALVIAGIAFAMGDKSETYTWRYKTTIVVETPEGLKTGSAVRETTVDYAVCMGCNPKVSTKGEAAFVDLGKRGKVFEVMGTDPYMTVFYALPGPPGLTREGQKYYSTLKNAKVSLNTGNLTKNIFTQYPMMVTFKDIKDPKSVELVYQSEATRVSGHFDFKITDNFEKLFGSGVKLKDVTVEMTDEPVTHGIRSCLPSFDVDGYRKWVITLPYKDPRRLHNKSFIAGE